MSILSNTMPVRKNNGQVDLMNEDPDARFKMFERIAIRNKATEYRAPLQGIWEDNLLATLFFSKENIQILQNGLRAGVYQVSKKQYVIPPQNLDALKIVMRSTFLQYSKNSPNEITQQIRDLNKLVLDYCIPAVYNECVSYVKYVQDKSTLVMPLERELKVDRDYKQLELKPWF
jgi:Family of unknown function (DUF5761)